MPKKGDEMDKTTLAPPWITTMQEICVLFDGDPDIITDWDEESTTLKIYVGNAIKAGALMRLLPEEYTFGNVVMTVLVIPSNEPANKMALYSRAFAGNPAFSMAETVNLPTGGSMDFVLFEPKVVQYYNDDISDYNGICTTLYQDIAKRVFQDPDVHFCSVKVSG